ncbi:MAG: sensor domain-containing diguanylate cyclase [Candidatus Omnitrophica bacterium]|nr:sensor domain-containing diguanylate cyclase [Candidatus Omnitrophota bacterium]MCF7877436.1 sensor domain-containing diguanylate cyclase [Candidatus Omnitrophota bacterium]MCF7895937.1 sensor domain-containing diguanylate cyclase [Candidatus Omnitrophota bacterium]MCF7897977.1 sensor domain-containing diguanylate cyclase [Candidatus Omnitrophota bacterium]MCF7909750.1 sensor domain-containing diguanylate cyclase [Candidatus Omnitrophota bacterium]
MYNFFIYSILNLFIASIAVFLFVGLITPFWAVLFLFFLLSSFLVFYLSRKKLISRNTNTIDYQEERLNILENSLVKKNKILEYLPLKQKKSSFLVKLSQELIELEDIEDIFDFLVSAVNKLFPDFTFVSLYEFNKKNHSLELIRSLKKKDMAIKEKQGCEIERWMMRQNSSVLIEDIRKDFRFDSSQIDGFLQRKSLSFLASPLSVGEDFFGIIRIECEKANFFSYDDLRSLSNICDLGAVVLERANLIKRVRELAITDSLTALPLRNYFIEKAKTELNRAREGGTSAGLAMFDIDDFKKINDTHGHMVGDLVLKKFAKILKGVTEDPRITVCRYGGEEFMVLLADTDKEESLKIAESIRKKALDSTVLYRRNKVKFTISGGLVIYPDGKKDFDKIFSVADKMMYQAKNKGKNRICSSL